ncbi:hypothetical protein AVEN_179903-1 [Araneus ventricosus]|uniref:Uncharacterized protein n=1 Tax=Araneus ventricosus TaxID=182803 RepID=A0A4Y2M5D3_ARAVE|nr:hypothetical protein AVEN_179903-1 [Araneus ventricosus]
MKSNSQRSSDHRNPPFYVTIRVSSLVRWHSLPPPAKIPTIISPSLARFLQRTLWSCLVSSKYRRLCGRFGASAPPRFVIPHLHREALSFLRRLILVEECCVKFHLKPKASCCYNIVLNALLQKGMLEKTLLISPCDTNPTGQNAEKTMWDHQIPWKLKL